MIENPATAAVQPIRVRRIEHGRFSDRADVAAVEAPLQVILDGEPFAVVMRTPGDDLRLTAGFLFAESVVTSLADLAALTPGFGRSGEEIGAVAARLSPARARAWHEERPATSRRILTASACGLCGRATIESLRVHAAPLAADWTVEPDLILAAPRQLQGVQPGFARSGGLHAAGLFGRDGSLLASAEDIGRHNAVDKVIGRMLLEGRLPLSGTFLFVSGRASFEIVQKAWLAGIPIVGAVSAPSSFAIELAGESGITLLGFVRDGSLNAYSHVWRLEGGSSQPIEQPA